MDHPDYPDIHLSDDDRAIATRLGILQMAGPDWKNWVEHRSRQDAAEMLALLTWKFRCEVANNAGLGKMLTQVHHET